MAAKLTSILVSSSPADFIRGIDRPPGGYPDVPFSADVRAGKGTSFYRAHTYHTKVPPQGIEAFIAHCTKPGQVVLDPFCGSGMTGIAAIRQGRRAVLSDLSPAAAFFAFNHCQPLDVDAFLDAGRGILRRVEKQFGWLYGTADRTTGKQVLFGKMLWSIALRCPECGKRYSLWDAALDEKRNILAEYPCPHCGKPITKKKSKPAGWVPVRVDYGAGSRSQVPPESGDRALLERIEKMTWPDGLWYPQTPVPRDGDEIARLHNDGIGTVAELFTKRNLLCVAALWREACRAREACGAHRVCGDKTLRPALMFAVTGIMQRASRLNKFIPSLNMSPGPILGTMYIPGFYPEINALDLFRRKLTAIAKCHRELRPTDGSTGVPPVAVSGAGVPPVAVVGSTGVPPVAVAGSTGVPPVAVAGSAGVPPVAMVGKHGGAEDAVCVCTQSATDLAGIPDDSIDYVFTDPPFGSNIQYSELNLLWESWLGTLTDASQEAVVNASQGKDVAAYGALMAKSFAEMRRVLRPGAWLTLVFHNSSGEVWAAIQRGLADAGFAVASISTFDKAHDTFKMVTAPGAVGFDVVVNCRKVEGAVRQVQGQAAGLADAREFVRRRLASNPADRSPRLLHSRTIAHFMAQGRPIGFDFGEFRAMAADELKTHQKED